MGIIDRLFPKAKSPGEDKTDFILRKHLDGDFKVFPMAENPANETQIQTIAEQVGVRYPPELIAHICGQFPGLYVEVIESVWTRPKAYDVGPFWSFLYALHTYTSVPESEPWMRLGDAALSFQKKTGLKAAPVLRIVGDVDLYCVDSEGRIVRFRHEESKLEPMALTFWELLDREIGELAKRKARKIGLA